MSPSAARAPDSAQLAQRRREFALELDALVRRALMLGVAAADLPQWLLESLDRVRQDASWSDLHSHDTERSS